MFEFIAKNQEVLRTDFITWTGDNSAHNDWDSTDQDVTDYTTFISDALSKALGPDTEIEIYPVLGNHDTWPNNQQDFSKPYNNFPIN